MSKTVRNHADNQRSERGSGRENEPQKVPDPYPPVDPTVAQKKSAQQDR